MCAHVLLNLLNELRKRDKMLGLLSILSLFRNEFRFYLSYDKYFVNLISGVKNVMILSL